MSRMHPTAAAVLLVAALLVSSCWAWTNNAVFNNNNHGRASSPSALKVATASPWFADTTTDSDSTTSSVSVEKLKAQLLQLGAALDRGQAYNPTSGEYYGNVMEIAREKIEALLNTAPTSLPTSLSDMDGEWELVLSTVPHGIFRSSPFFLAIQESYEYAESKTFEDGTDKAGLFFKLHELQTCSWGVSKVGRIAQHIDADKGYLYSTFDTSLFSLTVIPILGWFKLLPTFGGCVVTAATCNSNLKQEEFQGRPVAKLDMVVDYTTSRKVPGLNGLPLLGDFIWKIKVPVGAIWKLLPWNKGREATCKVYIDYLDDDFRIVQDIDGEYFVYTRPVVPRALEGFD